MGDDILIVASQYEFSLISSSINNTLLVEEIQLKEVLNHCVHSDRRADFSLMLSMLTDDVLAQSQFKLPKTKETDEENTEATIRKAFDLPKEPRLSLEDIDDIDDFSQAKLIQEKQLSTLHLQEALNPKPISFRDDKTHIITSVLSNTSLYCQQQYHLRNENKPLEESRLAFNVNAWLKNIQTTIVKAPLLEMNV